MSTSPAPHSGLLSEPAHQAGGGTSAGPSPSAWTLFTWGFPQIPPLIALEPGGSLAGRREAEVWEQTQRQVLWPRGQFSGQCPETEARYGRRRGSFSWLQGGRELNGSGSHVQASASPGTHGGASEHRCRLSPAPTLAGFLVPDTAWSQHRLSRSRAVTLLLTWALKPLPDGALVLVPD